MKSIVKKTIVSAVIATGLLVTAAETHAYWRAGVWVGPGYGYRPYYRPYYYGYRPYYYRSYYYRPVYYRPAYRCGWVPGHWRAGYWVPGHRACW